MPEGIVRKELEALGIHVQRDMQLLSGRRDQDASTDRPLTPHYIVEVVQAAEVLEVRSLTEFCGQRVLVEIYKAPKAPLQCKRCERFGHTQRNWGYAPRRVRCNEAYLSGGSQTLSSSLTASAAW
jgi:hypothetical protein